MATGAQRCSVAPRAALATPSTPSRRPAGARVRATRFRSMPGSGLCGLSLRSSSRRNRQWSIERPAAPARSTAAAATRGRILALDRSVAVPSGDCRKQREHPLGGRAAVRAGGWLVYVAHRPPQLKDRSLFGAAIFIDRHLGLPPAGAPDRLTDCSSLCHAPQARRTNKAAPRHNEAQTDHSEFYASGSRS